jgi:hypothetical protein
MKSNIILSISTALMQVARVAIALLAAILILMFIGSFINDSINLPEFAKSVSVLNIEPSHTLYTLKEGNFWLSVFVILQRLLILIAWFQILGYGRDIMNNIKSIKTFAKDNVIAFSKISGLAIWLLIIHFILLSPDRISLSIKFDYLFFAFGAIILTQVFKQGQKLLEENELTV